MEALLLLAIVAAAAFLRGRIGRGDGAPPVSVEATRAAVPVEPGLVATSAMRGGLFFMGSEADRAYVRAALADRAKTDRRVAAFVALLPREGATTAINTYDNQILTWGPGFGGLGGLPKVLEILFGDPLVASRFRAVGIVPGPAGSFEVELADGSRAKGKDALIALAADKRLLCFLIDLARDPTTRDRVVGAMIDRFLATSANLPGLDAFATQAAVTFAVHLAHWAPAYMVGAVAEAASATTSMPAGPARDCAMLDVIVRHFYRSAQGRWMPSWKQLRGYVDDARRDGLDCAGSGLLSADSPPNA